MSDLRAAAQQALEALLTFPHDISDEMFAAIAALKAALAQEQARPTVKDSLQVESAATTQQPVGDTPPSDYRRGYWDGFEMGKREGRIAAEDAAKQAEPKGGGNLPPPWRCPQCGGPADNGHDRELPPNPYWCTRCVANARDDWK